MANLKDKIKIGALIFGLTGVFYQNQANGQNALTKEDSMMIKKLGVSGVQIVRKGPNEIYGKPVYVFGDTLKYDNKKYLLPQDEIINLDDFIDSVVINKQNIKKYLIMENKK